MMRMAITLMTISKEKLTGDPDITLWIKMEMEFVIMPRMAVPPGTARASLMQTKMELAITGKKADAGMAGATAWAEVITKL